MLFIQYVSLYQLPTFALFNLFLTNTMHEGFIMKHFRYSHKWFLFIKITERYLFFSNEAYDTPFTKLLFHFFVSNIPIYNDYYECHGNFDHNILKEIFKYWELTKSDWINSSGFFFKSFLRAFWSQPITRYLLKLLTLWKIVPFFIKPLLNHLVR